MKTMTLVLMFCISVVAQSPRNADRGKVGGFIGGNKPSLAAQIYGGSTNKPASTQPAIPPGDFRILDGKLYNVARAKGWEDLEIIFDNTIENGIAGQKFREAFIRPLDPNRPTPPTTRHRREFVAVTNYPKDKALIPDSTLRFRAMYRTNAEIGGQIVMVYDYGRKATSEEVRAELEKRGR